MLRIDKVSARAEAMSARMRNWTLGKSKSLTTQLCVGIKGKSVEAVTTAARASVAQWLNSEREGGIVECPVEVFGWIRDSWGGDQEGFGLFRSFRLA
jgi:hypothetical protein